MKDNKNNVLLNGLIFTVLITIFNLLLYRGLRAIITGLITGVIYTIIVGIYTSIQMKKYNKIKDQLSPKHNMIYDSPANYLSGKYAVRGYLFLTDQLLIFRTEDHKSDFSIPVDQLSAVSPFKSFMWQGMMIESNASQSIKLSVSKNTIWIEKIKQYIV